MEFLVHMQVTAIPGGKDAESALLDQESQRARELAESGILVRLWRIPGRRENWGIWQASDTDQLHGALASLPLFPYLVITVHPLASHPNDPRNQASRDDAGADQQDPQARREMTTASKHSDSPQKRVHVARAEFEAKDRTRSW